jgi:hypothetical protein
MKNDVLRLEEFFGSNVTCPERLKLLRGDWGVNSSVPGISWLFHGLFKAEQGGLNSRAFRKPTLMQMTGSGLLYGGPTKRTQFGEFQKASLRPKQTTAIGKVVAFAWWKNSNGNGLRESRPRGFSFSRSATHRPDVNGRCRSGL